MKQAALTKRRVPLRVLPAPDLPFLMLVLTLVGFGLVMLGSASGAVALYRRGDALAYLRPQMLYAAMGIAGMGLASRVDYHIFHKLAWPLLAVSLVLLAAVLFMPEYNGCKRWLVLPGLGTLQPSEIAKFAVVLVFSHIISLNHDRMQSFAVGVLPFALVLGVVAALMLLEPHLSGTLLILGIGAVLMFVGGTGLRWFVLAGVGGAAAIATAVILMPELVPYAADRLRSWQDPFADPLGDGHQTIQSLYAIGSGGATGLGLGNSRQKHLFVPEPQNDFIFSIVCEELAFCGSLCRGGAVRAAAVAGHRHRGQSPRPLRGLARGGVRGAGGSQAVLNVAVVTNTIPNTGISLPFFLLRRHQPDDAAGRNGNRLVGFERRDLKSPNKLDGRSDPNIQPSFRILWGIFCEMGAAFMENRIVVTGGRPLNGAVRIPAAKNSVLPLLAASMLCSERVRLRAVPRLSDVAVSLALLRGAGCAARWEGEDLVLSGPPKTGALPGKLRNKCGRPSCSVRRCWRSWAAPRRTCPAGAGSGPGPSICIWPGCGRWGLWSGMPGRAGWC